MIDKRFRKIVIDCFRHYKKLLNLPPNFRIKIGINKKLKDYAEVNYDYDAKIFNILINPSKNKDLETLKDSILHECFHIFFTPMTSRLDLLFEEIRNKKPFNYKLTKKKALMWEEMFVDKLTKLIVKLEKEQD